MQTYIIHSGARSTLESVVYLYILHLIVKAKLVSSPDYIYVTYTFMLCTCKHTFWNVLMMGVIFMIHLSSICCKYVEGLVIVNQI